MHESNADGDHLSRERSDSAERLLKIAQELPGLINAAKAELQRKEERIKREEERVKSEIHRRKKELTDRELKLIKRELEFNRR